MVKASNEAASHPATKSSIITEIVARKRPKFSASGGAIRPVGSIAYRLAKVAGGDGDGTLTFRTIYEWDICAGVLIVEEAGGKAVDGDGNSLRFNRQPAKHKGVVAANPALSADLQELWAAAVAARNQA